MQYYKHTVKPKNLLSDLRCCQYKIMHNYYEVNYLQATKRGHKHCASNVTGHYLAIYTPLSGVHGLLNIISI